MLMKTMVRRLEFAGIGALSVATLLIVGTVVSPLAAADVVVQDGYAYSGTVNSQPIGPKFKLEADTSWPAGVGLGGFAFRSAVYDGEKVWLLPVDADHFVQIDPVTGDKTALAVPGVTATAQRFAGGVFDGTQIHLVPFDADRVLSVSVADETTSGHFDWPEGFVKTSGAFAGGVFDGAYVWFLPHNADRVVRMDPVDGSMTGFADWPAGFVKGPEAFWGGVFDGRYIWLVPYSADRVVRLDTQDGSMVGFADWPAGFSKGAQAFAAAAFDGQRVWMAPYNADGIVVLDTTDGSMEAVPWPEGFSPVDEAYAGALFDGQDVWFVPFNESRLLRVDAETREVRVVDAWPSAVTPSAASKFAGALFDGTRIFLAPAEQTVLVTISPDDPARLVNISARAVVGAGDEKLIPGFVIGGTTSRRILVRGIGPALDAFGVEGELQTPVLTLHDGEGPITSNQGWENAPNAAEIVSVSATVGAFELTEGSADCAILAELAPGAYTAHLAGLGDTVGIGMVEVYDAEPDAGTGALLNVSARARVGVGDDVLIPGVAVAGRESGRLLIRAIGPGLAQYEVADFLADPILTVNDAEGVPILTNDNWSDAENAAEIAEVAESVGAFALEPGSRDAAVLIELPPSSYTVRVAGVGDTTGIASVEIYFVP